MTADEHNDLHEQSVQLAYLAIRYTDLSPLLSCEEWDSLSDQIGKEVVELMLRRVYAVRDARGGGGTVVK